MRRILISIGWLAWLAGVAAAAPPPTVVFIVADEMGSAAAGFNGGPAIHPPRDAANALPQRRQKKA